MAWFIQYSYYVILVGQLHTAQSVALRILACVRWGLLERVQEKCEEEEVCTT